MVMGFSALKEHFPRVATLRIYATNHAHQRGFTGPVFSAQRMDLTFLNFKIDIIQRPDSGKFLGQILNLKNKFAHPGFLFPVNRKTGQLNCPVFVNNYYLISDAL